MSSSSSRSIRSERRGSDVPPTPRSSAFSAVLPRLRRSETVGDDISQPKSVLVTLKLSSQSFLDSVIKDDASINPLYTVRTLHTSTSVFRSDPWDGLTKTAEIKWPQRIPTKGKTKETLGVLVQMSDGRWQTGDAVLKPGTMLSSPPRFHIPNFPHSLKWKRVGSVYWCTTSTVKGPIATFHPAVEGIPPRIKVFETLHSKYNAQPVLTHNGVSFVLMDYLIVTAMLLVTDVQDWMLVKKYQGEDDERSPRRFASSSTSASSVFDRDGPSSAPASASQWRKILYGEPIFPKRYPNSRAASTTDLSTPTPTSMKQMAKIIYGDPIYPSLASPAASLWESEDDDDGDGDQETWHEQREPYDTSYSVSTSPLARVYSSDSVSVLEPSIPPVPPIPTQYASSSRPSSARPRTPKELPTPPTPVSDAHRSISSAPSDWDASSTYYGRRPSSPLVMVAGPSSSAAPSPLSELPPLTPLRSLSRSQSMKFRRQLPTPPPEQSMPSPRRGSYSQRSLPMPPMSTSAAVPPPPPLPQPLQRKDPPQELWSYSWENANLGTAQSFEAPPPYMMVAQSPTSTSAMAQQNET
ncbi:hypothetical protein FB45DRAFT_1051591 [Roridomyces roridus]|uniref:Uncharacterized protein n=1 Tax=Roridomyces roridus TaxID=1738132 RepID=A0AAD7CEM5_9AGAR|nr:hypothetical protein FB45DRAFT_1051591 [Roridomyces roridus]